MALGTFDNIQDLLDLIKSQGLDYHLTLIELNPKDNNDKIHIFSSLNRKEFFDLIKFLKKVNKDGQEE